MVRQQTCKQNMSDSKPNVCDVIADDTVTTSQLSQSTQAQQQQQQLQEQCVEMDVQSSTEQHVVQRVRRHEQTAADPPRRTSTSSRRKIRLRIVVELKALHRKCADGTMVKVDAFPRLRRVELPVRLSDVADDVIASGVAIMTSKCVRVLRCRVSAKRPYRTY